MREILAVEMPSLREPMVLELGLVVQDIRAAVIEGALRLLRQHGPDTHAVPLIVVFSLLQRMSETTLALEVLVSKGFIRDTATLLVVLMELRLDLQYIARVPGSEAVWLAHNEQSRKPWKVRDQINTIHASESEREAERDVYRVFSMAKHGNPSGGAVSFKFPPIGEGLQLPDDGLAGRMLPGFLYGAGANLLQGINAGAQIVERAGFVTASVLETLEPLSKRLEKLHMEHVTNLMVAHAQAQQDD